MLNVCYHNLLMLHQLKLQGVSASKALSPDKLYDHYDLFLFDVIRTSKNHANSKIIGAFYRFPIIFRKLEHYALKHEKSKTERI
jgi:hypothetical protein